VFSGSRERHAIFRYVFDDALASTCPGPFWNVGISTVTNFSIDATPYFSGSPVRHLTIELKKNGFHQVFSELACQYDQSKIFLIDLHLQGLFAQFWIYESNAWLKQVYMFLRQRLVQVHNEYRVVSVLWIGDIWSECAIRALSEIMILISDRVLGYGFPPNPISRSNRNYPNKSLFIYRYILFIMLISLMCNTQKYIVGWRFLGHPVCANE
jgi:hypothetical protein